MDARVELTLRIGRFGEESHTVCVPVDEYLARKLTEPVELSDDAFSLLLASPGMFGGHGDAVTLRKEKFELRRAEARSIAKAIEDQLFKMFGVNDEMNGYPVHKGNGKKAQP